MKNLAAPLIGLGVIPTTRGPLDAITVARAKPENRAKVAMNVAFNPETAMDRSGLQKFYSAYRSIGTLN